MRAVSTGGDIINAVIYGLSPSLLLFISPAFHHLSPISSSSPYCLRIQETLDRCLAHVLTYNWRDSYNFKGRRFWFEPSQVRNIAQTKCLLRHLWCLTTKLAIQHQSGVIPVRTVRSINPPTGQLTIRRGLLRWVQTAGRAISYFMVKSVSVIRQSVKG